MSKIGLPGQEVIRVPPVSWRTLEVVASEINASLFGVVDLSKPPRLDWRCIVDEVLPRQQGD